MEKRLNSYVVYLTSKDVTQDKDVSLERVVRNGIRQLRYLAISTKIPEH